MKYTGESFKKAILDFYERTGRTITDEEMNAIEAKAYQLDQELELKPFDKVLVRNSPIGLWIPALYGKCVDGKYLTSAGWQSVCVRYESNEELLGTNTPKQN